MIFGPVSFSNPGRNISVSFGSWVTGGSGSGAVTTGSGSGRGASGSCFLTSGAASFFFLAAFFDGFSGLASLSRSTLPTTLGFLGPAGVSGTSAATGASVVVVTAGSGEGAAAGAFFSFFTGFAGGVRSLLSSVLTSGLRASVRRSICFLIPIPEMSVIRKSLSGSPLSPSLPDSISSMERDLFGVIFSLRASFSASFLTLRSLLYSLTIRA
ncbi:MAG: hypothetical protein BWY89_01326 [Bacteroidetes bacterium ADurb.BinA012]|nr:MAG: hypothetical protein BWY89_01326 [Bacteroidetes bacterium ADurb.BinA012]